MLVKFSKQKRKKRKEKKERKKERKKKRKKKRKKERGALKGDVFNASMNDTHSPIISTRLYIFHFLCIPKCIDKLTT